MNMPRLPNEDPRLLEALEACRPGSDDLAQPEMAGLASRLAESAELDELRARLQRLDVALADAFHDVPVPEGLEARVLARLAGAQPGGVEPEHAAASPSAVAAPPATAPVPARSRRRPWRVRWWLVAGPALAASILILLLQGMPRTERLSLEQFLAAAIGHFNQDEDAREGAAALHAGSPGREGYPISRAIPLDDFQIAWRAVDGFPQGLQMDLHGIAYDVKGAAGLVATLYVLDGRVDIPLKAEPPAEPMHSTAQRSAVAWQEEGGRLVYVLVVVGEGEVYQWLLARGQGTVT
jgi:hypothetical protein